MLVDVPFGLTQVLGAVAEMLRNGNRSVHRLEKIRRYPI